MSATGAARRKARVGWWGVVAVGVTLAATQVGAGQQTSRGLEAVPENPPPALASAKSLLVAGNFKQADAALRDYLAGDGTSAEAHYMLAYALLREDKPKESLDEYTRAAALHPPTARQLREVGQDYVLLEDYGDAEKWMTRSTQMDPGDPEGWYSLGRLRYTQQRYTDAAECFRRTLALAPGSVKAENNLGLALEGLNDGEGAVAAYQQAIAWQDAGPRDKVSEQPLLNLAIVLMHRGADGEALPLLQRAAALAPADPRVQEFLGQVYEQQGNFGEAAKSLEAATRLDPGRSNLHFLLGQAYRHLGRQQEAKTEFEAAARLAKPSANP